MITDFAFLILVTIARNVGCENIFPTKWCDSPQVVGVADLDNLDGPTVSQCFGTRRTFADLFGFAVLEQTDVIL